jgi:hypothetical protein
MGIFLTKDELAEIIAEADIDGRLKLCAYLNTFHWAKIVDIYL